MGKLLVVIVAFTFLADALMFVDAQAMGFESESNNNLKVADPDCPKPEGKLEKFVECLRCLPGVPKKKCGTRDDKTASVWYSETLNIKKGQILDLSFKDLEKDRAQDIANNPEVHATFEYISSTDFPVEFVSDPFFFGKHDVHLCKAQARLKTLMDTAKAQKPIFHDDFLKAGVGLTVQNTQQMDQALQVTYSFPAARAWKAVEVLNIFTSKTWDMNIAKPISAFFVNQAVQFLNNQQRMEDHVKYFVFHMLQFFYNGYAGGGQVGCFAGAYAKLIADFILPRSNFYQYIRLALGTKSVKNTFGTASKAIETILDLQTQFVKFFTGRVSTAKIQTLPAGTCQKSNKAYFALTYGDDSETFPFSFEQFITELWKDSTASNAPQTLDLFRKFAPAFDRAIGLWNISPSKPIIGFEARLFRGFKYPVAPLHEQFDWKIPTLYNLGIQMVSPKLDLNKLDLGLKTCKGTSLISFVSKTTPPPLIDDWKNAGQKVVAKNQPRKTVDDSAVRRPPRGNSKFGRSNEIKRFRKF